MKILNLIRYNLTNLLNFSGRDSRADFWPYVAFVVGIMFVGMMAIMVPMMADLFGKMRQFAAAHPDQATVESGPGTYSISIQGNHPELMPDMTAITGGFSIVCLAVICLLAAAVVRRLHDRGKSGAWGLMPLPFLATGFAMMPKIFAEPVSDMTLFNALFFNNLVYLASLGLLIAFLAGESEKTENRYGPPPTDS